MLRLGLLDDLKNHSSSIIVDGRRMVFLYMENSIHTTVQITGGLSMEMQNIWWVEEEIDEQEAWQQRLNDIGYELHYYSYEELIYMLQDRTFPKLVIFHASIVDDKTLDWVKYICSSRMFPLIAINAYGGSQENVLLFEHGANDVVGSEISSDEMIARIRNLIMLFELPQKNVNEISYEDLLVQIHSHRVYRNGEMIRLTPKEFELLLYMAQRISTVCDRNAILHDIWGHEFLIDTNVVDVYIRHLRKKIDSGRKRKLIHTVRGVGYMLQ